MIEKLHELLTSDAPSRVYRLAGRTSASTISEAVAAAGWQFLHVDGSAVKDKASFLNAAAGALRFPAWAGRNWDAFEELVNDLAWLPQEPGTVVLLDRLSHFAQREPQQVRMAVEILVGAAAHRAKAGERPLIVLVRGAGTAAARLALME